MVRVRIKYEKIGTIRFTSHRDLMRLFRRSLAAGEVPVCYSQGFNPHPRLSFGPSLRTGWEGLGEYMDLLLEADVPDLEERCNPNLPAGLRIVATTRIPDHTPKLSSDIKAARYEIIVDAENLARGKCPPWDAFKEAHGHTSDTPPVDTLRQELHGRFGSRDLEDGGHPALIETHIHNQDGQLCVEYLSTMNEGKSLFPEELMEPVLGNPTALAIPVKVVRKDLYVRRAGEYHSPISDPAVRRAT